MSAWKAFYKHKQCSSEEELKYSRTLSCLTGFKQKGIISFRDNEKVMQEYVKE